MPYPKSMSIIPADQTIAVEGEAYRCSFAAGEKVHAIQWFGDHGQIEVANGPAHGFANADMLDPYLAAWRKGRALALRGQHAERARHLGQITQTLDSHTDAISHLTKEVAMLDKQLAEGGDASVQNSRDRLANQIKMTAAEIVTIKSMKESVEAVVIQLDTRAAQAEQEA